MSAVVIAYPPMAGGNHFKNLLCLDPSFANSSDLNTAVYTDPSSDNIQPVGTVHSVGGRNVHRYLFEKISAAPEKTWLIHGHFGELAPFRTQLNSIHSKKYIVITIDTEDDRKLLLDRQTRLGGTSGHPYYLDEEQLYLYQPAMYESYFISDDVMTCSISEIWDPDFTRSKIIQRWNNFLNIHVDAAKAQHYHTIWWNSNFTILSNHVRTYYGQASNQA
jgi:hypothetical protein